MRTPRHAPLVWLPVWVWLFVGVIALLVVFFFTFGAFRAPPRWRVLGIEPAVAENYDLWGDWGSCADLFFLRVTVTRNGKLRYRGEAETTLRSLQDQLRLRTASGPSDRHGRDHPRAVLEITADARCGWAMVHSLFALTTRGDIGLSKTEWRVRGRDLSDYHFLVQLMVALPKSDQEVANLRVDLLAGERDQVHERIRILTVDSEHPLAEIRVHPEVPYGKVVEVVDRLIGDGVRTFRFVSP